MKRSRFTEEQIIGFIQHPGGPVHVPPAFDQPNGLPLELQGVPGLDQNGHVRDSDAVKGSTE